jgi:regulator of protease activity HflC (stomatin/prohibitin superfamily)
MGGLAVKRKTLAFATLLSMPACVLPGCPGYSWYQGLRIEADNREAEGEGRSTYLRAEQDRRVKVLEAQAMLESAKMRADAEVARARGVAEANMIIGDSLKGNESYLRWLWIEEVARGSDNKMQIIYVPTETGIPILEAGKR